jgi:hypothetical protein
MTVLVRKCSSGQTCLGILGVFGTPSKKAISCGGASGVYDSTFNCLAEFIELNSFFYFLTTMLNLTDQLFKHLSNKV